MITSKEIGKGNFSKLIRELKEKYKIIKIPTPSKMMIVRAIHLGFELKKEYFKEPYKEWADVLHWERMK